MLNQQLANLKQFILDNNTYFNSGYDNVYQNDKGLIGDNSKLIFPADDLGNYFYLRLPKNITASIDKKYSTNDCTQSLLISSAIILVACVRDADPDKLIGNLLSTILQFGQPIVIGGLIIKKEEVILQELAKITAINIDTALKNVDKNYTIVSISFSISTPFTVQKLNCITNPCKTC